MADDILIFSTTAPADGNLRSDVPPRQIRSTGNESAWERIDGTVYLTPDGELVNPLPADATHYTRIFETHATDNILTVYTGRYGEPWVLKFDGTASSVSSGLSNVNRVGNRITGTWPANQSNKQITFTGMNNNDPPRNIRFCPAEWEAMLDGGEIFNPQWLAEAKRGSGLIRFMDWMATNNNRSTRTFASIPTESFYIWGGFNGSTSYLRGGMPVLVMTNLAKRCNSHAWVCIPHVFGTPKTARMGASVTVAITIASPGVVTWTGHGLSADWPVRFTTTGALPTGLVSGTVYYVVGASIATNTFQVSATPGGAAINTSGSQSGTQTGTALGLTQSNPPAVFSLNHPFVNGDQVIPYLFSGMSQSATVTITIATPGVITWTAHPLQANNAITIEGGTLPTGLTIGNAVYVKDVLSVDTFTVSATPGGAAINTTGSQSGTHTATTQIARNTFTIANATTNTFELAGVDASGFSVIVDNIAWLTSPYSLSGMTTQMTLLATYFRDNMTSDLMTFWEFSNECWNSIFDAFHWLAAQARAKFPNDNSYRMTGYLMAHCMKTARDVFGTNANARARWRGVLGTFSLGSTVGTEMLSGVSTYLAENPPLVLSDLIDDIAVVGYWGGNLEDNGTAGAVTIDIGTSTFTRASHGYLEGNPLKFTTTGTLPTPVVVGTIFYAKNVTGSTFQISLTSGGAVSTLGGSQAGTHTVNRVYNDLSQQWLDDGISRFNAGLETSLYAYLSRVVNEDLLDGRYSGIQFSITNSETILWVPNKTLADANGLGLIQYEGGNSNALADGGRSANAQWRAAFPNIVLNSDDGANYKEMMDRFIAMGGRFPAKFTEANTTNVFGAFGALPYPGAWNQVWNAVCDFNDKLWSGRLGR